MSPLSTPLNSDNEDSAQESDEEADAENQDPSSLNLLIATENDIRSNIHPSLHNKLPATPPHFIAQCADSLLSDSTAIRKYDWVRQGREVSTQDLLTVILA